MGYLEYLEYLEYLGYLEYLVAIQDHVSQNPTSFCYTLPPSHHHYHVTSDCRLHFDYILVHEEGEETPLMYHLSLPSQVNAEPKIKRLKEPANLNWCLEVDEEEEVLDEGDLPLVDVCAEVLADVAVAEINRTGVFTI